VETGRFRALCVNWIRNLFSPLTVCASAASTAASAVAASTIVGAAPTTPAPARAGSPLVICTIRNTASSSELTTSSTMLFTLIRSSSATRLEDRLSSAVAGAGEAGGVASPPLSPPMLCEVCRCERARALCFLDFF
jgi:hypothetical protein